MKGWVYVASNPHFKHVKIGFTDRDPDSRVRELFTTGVPAPFRGEYVCLVDSAYEVEQRVHFALSSHRASENREFFSCSIPEAILSIRQAAGASLLFEEVRYRSPEEIADEERKVEMRRREHAAIEQQQREASATSELIERFDVNMQAILDRELSRADAIRRQENKRENIAVKMLNLLDLDRDALNAWWAPKIRALLAPLIADQKRKLQELAGEKPRALLRVQTEVETRSLAFLLLVRSLIATYWSVYVHYADGTLAKIWSERNSSGQFHGVAVILGENPQASHAHLVKQVGRMHEGQLNGKVYEKIGDSWYEREYENGSFCSKTTKSLGPLMFDSRQDQLFGKIYSRDS